jgi:protein-histidine pros-kinase
MKWIPFKDLRIGRKLTRMSMIASASALLLSCAAFVTYELLTFDAVAAQHLHANAQIVGINVTPALLFRDPAAAAETLAALRATPNIISAAVYATDGALFAKYVRGFGNERSAIPPDLENARRAGRSGPDDLVVLSPILSDGKPAGTVYIQSDRREIEARLQGYAAISAAVLILSLAVALMVSAILQRRICAPILKLAEITRRIASQKDYSLRAAIGSKDEIGTLGAAFDEMLRQMQEQTESVQQSDRGSRALAEEVRRLNARLEERVAERTSQLQESQEQLRAATETANDAIVSADAAGNIINFNQGASRSFGYPFDEVIGKSLTLLMPARFHEAHLAGMKRYLATGEARVIGRTAVLTGRRKDGSEFPMELSLASWQSRGMAYFTAIIRDITEANRFAETLKSKNVELENANLSKDRFLASMSHELRTPLNAIIGFTGTLLMKLPGPLNADQERQLKTVQGSGRHLLSLINELLDLAKIEAGKVDLRLEATMCRTLVEEVVASLRPQAEAKGLQFDLMASKDELSVHTDQRVLSQIILNLANNAIKFTQAGSVLIHLRPHGEEIEIAVSDTGVGIRPEDQVKLFGAFSQVNDASRSMPEGTGLGLHLSRKLAGLLGGRITLQSEYGKGSTFTLTLART